MISRILSTTAMLALTAGTAAADFNLTILHTNDFHDRFEPISGSDGPCSAEDAEAGACFGGAARLVTAVNGARAAGNNTIFVDAGDWFQGTLFYTQYKGSMTADMMNSLAYDAMAVGNHEFDDGPDVLADFADAVEFPLLMANADITGEALLTDKIQKSVVIENNGERIGLIGLTPVANPELASPGPNIIFTPPADAVQAEVDAMTADGINKIVVLSHSGYNVDLELAAAVTGVDVIVGGHDNSLLGDMEGAKGPYPTMVGDTAIVHAYAYGKYLGMLDVTFDDDGVVTAATGQPMLLDVSVEEDQATLDMVAELAGPLEEIRNEVIGEAAANIDGNRDVCRVMECSGGNLIADAMLARVADQGIQVAFANSGGIRASIDEGEVTKGAVLTVLPFQNTLSTFQVTGQVLLDALENGVSQMADVSGRFPQVAGMTFTVDADAEVGARISDVTIAGAPIDPAATYGVVSNNYVRNGGDGYAMFTTAENAYDFGPDLADVVAEYIAATGDAYEPYTDGRITVN